MGKLRLNYTRKEFWILSICLSLPVFAVGITVGYAWHLDDLKVFTEGVPTVCKITRVSKSGNPKLGYHADIEYIQNDRKQAFSHPISTYEIRNLNGRTYLVFWQPGEPASIRALFLVPVEVNKNIITIDMSEMWDNDSFTIEEILKQ